ncbi:MAG: hypothetical protein K8F62_19325 [Pseudorhodoplanes sp.]|nr:hypothetical protein [Pseudorhodoplanes sp.]
MASKYSSDEKPNSAKLLAVNPRLAIARYKIPNFDLTTAAVITTVTAALPSPAACSPIKIRLMTDPCAVANVLAGNARDRKSMRVAIRRHVENPSIAWPDVIAARLGIKFEHGQIARLIAELPCQAFCLRMGA